MSAASDRTGATTPSSTLSPEAAEFVPGRFSQSDHGDGAQQQEGGGKSLAEVPRYLTTCYPFVNPASTQRAKLSADSAGAAVGGGRVLMPGTAFAGNIRHPPPHLCPYPQQVGFAPAPHPAWLPGLQPAPTFTPALNLAPLTPGVHMPFDGGTGPRGRGLLPTPPKGDGLLPTPPYPPLKGPAVMGAAMVMPFASSPQLLLSPEGKGLSAAAAAAAARGRHAQAGRGHSVNVSRGTQKETFSVPPSGRTHTLILKDNSVQTDFHKDVADLTLQDKPSVLYRRGQRKNKGSQPIASTDSEEVDSDSGYSSPLHRRNVVSNGTHPVRISALVEVGEGGKASVPTGERGTAAGRAEASVVGLVSDAGMGHRLHRDLAASSPGVWGKGSGSPAVIGKADSAGLPASVWVKEPGKSGAQSPGTKERSRTPVNFRDSPRSEEEAASKAGSAQEDGRSGGVGRARQSSGGGSSSRDSPGKQSRSPGSVRRNTAPSPTPPEFPILKPAKRNEPPWSLTPNVHKGKKGESSGFLGMVADSVKSYASIVKSLSSPSDSQTAPPAVAAPPPLSHTQPAQPPDKRVDAAGGARGVLTATPTPTPGAAGVGTVPAGGASTAGTGLAHIRKGEEGVVIVSRELALSQGGEAGSTGLRLWKKGGPAWGGSGGGGVGVGVADGGVRQELGVWVGRTDAGARLSSGAADAGRPAWAGAGPVSGAQPLGAWGSGAQRTAPGAGPHRADEGPPRRDSGGAGAQRLESVAGAHGPDTGPHRPDTRVNRVDTGAHRADPGANRIEAGTRRADSGAPRITDGGAPKTDPATKGSGAEPRNVSKQHCDTQANRLGAGEGGVHPNLPANNLQSAAGKSRVAPAPISQNSGHRSVSRDRSSGKGGNKSDTAPQPSAASGDEKTEDEGKKKPRRRRRRRHRRKAKNPEGEGLSDGLSGMERTVSSSNISRTSDVTLHFEDELEFLEMGASSGNEGLCPVSVPQAMSTPPAAQTTAFMRVESMSPLSYSEALRRKPSINDVRSRTQSAPGSCLSGEEGGDENFNSQPGQGSSGQAPLSKRARKRRKRRELANRAAEAELAEISFEQQMLRELGHKVTGRGSRPSSGSRDERSRSRDEKSPARGLITDPNIVKQSKGGGAASLSGKRLHQPIALNIADMLDAFEKKKTLDQKLLMGGAGKKATLGREDGKSQSTNVLDASAPSKRGKERETPKPKKPSPLKKVILKEREEKKRMRLIGDCDVYADVDIPDDPDPDEPDPDVIHPENDFLDDSNAGNPVGLGESDLSQDGMSSRSVDTDQGVSPGADLSPISQTSPLSMSPLTPGASPLNSPIAGYLGRDPVVLRIHSRRFREYCTQILDKDIDTCCTSLLHELVRFQDRMYHKDPTKAKGKRRVVLGLREVTKHLKLKKIKCVIISPNLEKIQSKGGLDEALNNILTMCQEQNVPFVFALGRRALGRACAKLVPVSVAGIFNYEGCEEKFNQLISLTHKGRDAYADMVQAVEHEIAENPPPSLTAGSSVPSIYAHMGHSRTPSGCSAISFTSSVLSEPISENYPHAEPETDSKGYEIVRDQDGNVVATSGGKSYQNGGVLGAYQPSVDDFDDGNEADTEDINDCPPRRKGSGGAGKKAEDSAGARLINNKAVSGNHLAPAGVVANHDVTGLSSNHVEAAAEPSRATPSGDEAPDAATDTPERREVISEDGDSASESDSQRLGGGGGGDSNLPHIDSIHSSAYELSAEILSQHSSRTVDNSEVLSTHSSRTLGDGSLTPNTEHGRDRPHTPESSSGRGSRGARLTSKDRVQSWVESCLQEEQACSSSSSSSSSSGHNSSTDSDGGGVGVEGAGSGEVRA